LNSEPERQVNTDFPLSAGGTVFKDTASGLSLGKQPLLSLPSIQKYFNIIADDAKSCQ
jgi:hypothetical protein